MKNIDILYYLFNYYEIDSDIRNGNIFSDVIDDINKNFNISINFEIYSPGEYDYTLDIARGIMVINELVFEEQYQEFVLALLKNKKYYMKTFIKDLIKRLGNESEKCELEMIIDKYLRLPFIHNINFNGVDKYTIQTDYGDYSFTLADKVLNDEYLIEYIRSRDHKRDCHGNTTMLLNDYIDLYSICSLCRNYFVDYYYHSYGYVKENDLVFDICSNMFMEKKAFDDLYAPREVLFMCNDELKKMYFAKIQKIKSKIDFAGILKCALYFQSLELNNNLEEKKRILKFNSDENLQ